jgi:hypothetical protein
MSPLYLPICGIPKAFQENFRVPSLKFQKLLFCVPVPLLRQQGVIVIFHAKCVILTMSVYRFSLHERMVGNRDAHPELL